MGALPAQIVDHSSSECGYCLVLEALMATHTLPARHSCRQNTGKLTEGLEQEVPHNVLHAFYSVVKLKQ